MKIFLDTHCGLYEYKNNSKYIQGIENKKKTRHINIKDPF
jgi:hypothetical protein